MPQTYQINIDYEVIKDIFYKIHPHHRQTGLPNKSTWSISYQEEINCFVFTYNSNYIEINFGFGFLLNNTRKLEVIGTSINDKKLKFAKFVDGNNNHRWHGYPADYINNKQDKPSEELLLLWKNSGIITKPQFKRVKGRICYI